jgi:hypothetical protein
MGLDGLFDGTDALTNTAVCICNAHTRSDIFCFEIFVNVDLLGVFICQKVNGWFRIDIA